MIYRQTRLAPTPSGFLHLGNVLSFSVTAFLAKRTGARILLRIDDMDRERAQAEYIQDIFDTLNFLDIPFDEGPLNQALFTSSFSQIHRLGLYQQALTELQNKNAVFACTCSRSQLAAEAQDDGYPGTCRSSHIPLDTPGAAWRVYTDDRMITVKDMSGTETAHSIPSAMRDFIVRKKDGFPAYQLSSLVDDLHWNTDLIVRGKDLLSSTLAQLFLATLIDKQPFSNVHFYHHPLLSDGNGQKLSKSAGATSIHFLKNKGAGAENIFSMIGEMLGRNDIRNWQELGKVVVGAD